MYDTMEDPLHVFIFFTGDGWRALFQIQAEDPAISGSVPTGGFQLLN